MNSKAESMLLNKIFSDLAIIIREYCYSDDMTKEERFFLGQYADAVHNLPKIDLLSDLGKRHLMYYVAFLKETAETERIVQPEFLAKFEQQINLIIIFVDN
ncbi:hypothetical protein FEW53_002353 [Enterococcus faecalis]|nr:hypothetical protein [Enterococcus faecalis]